VNDHVAEIDSSASVRVDAWAPGWEKEALAAEMNNAKAVI
jgi:hypothetical protein